MKGIEELRPLFYKHGKGYHIRFVPAVWTQATQVVVNNFIIDEFYSITLLIQEIVIQGEVSDMEIHIRYEHIEDFSVLVDEAQ